MYAIRSYYALYKAPKNAFVSSFVGRSNLIQGTVLRSVSDKTRLKLSDNSEIELEKTSSFLPNSNVMLCLRPENISLTESVNGRLKGKVSQQFFMGNHWVYLVDTPVGQIEVMSMRHEPTLTQSDYEIGLNWSDTNYRLLPTSERAEEVSPA